MKRVLVIEYSQSGDVTRVADAFTRPLIGPGVQVRRERLRPVQAYPYPWGSLWRLFRIFPECHLPGPEGVFPPTLGPEERFDLVILAYQVWHLAPSIPVQAFLRSDHARVLKDTPVITLCVSRNMWHSASETMKRLLGEAGAVHLDNVVVTHPGPPFATFVSVPRALLYGKRDRLWGIFPSAELSQRDLDRAQRLGAALAACLDNLRPPYGPLLRGLEAVPVQLRYIVPELLGWHLYRAGARLVTRAGPPGRFVRELAIFVCLALLPVMVLCGIPVCFVVVLLLYPWLRGRISRYARRLAEPSG